MRLGGSRGDGDDDSGLLNNYVNVLHLTSDGKLWIGFYGGMGYYDLRSGKYVNIEDFSVSNATVNALTSVGDSLLLVGTSQGLIEYSLKTGKTKRYASSDGLSDNEVRTIEIDGNGRRWIGTVNGMSCLNLRRSRVVLIWNMKTDSEKTGFGSTATT